LKSKSNLLISAWLAEKMTKDGHAVALLSGELSVEDRIKVENYLYRLIEKSSKYLFNFGDAKILLFSF